MNRQVAAATLAINLSMRPMAVNEHVPRKETLLLSKETAEGTPNDVQIVLGCGIDTRCLILFLPGDKFVAWNRDLVRVIKEKLISRGGLD